MIQLRGLHPELRPYAEYAVQWAEHLGIKPQVTSVYRSLDEQRALRANFERCAARGLQGKAVSITPGMSCSWPANRPGESGHNYGFAWDSWVPQHQMSTWSEIRRRVGWRVPENDVIHAELPDWRKFV